MKEDKKDEPKEGQSKDEEAWMAMVMCDISDGDYSGLDEAHCDDFHAEAYSCFIEDDLFHHNLMSICLRPLMALVKC